MLFTSFAFVVFVVILFLLYWLVLPTNLRFQNVLLLTASYVFYGWWNVHFLWLMGGSSLIAYWVGWQIGQSQKPQKRKFWLFLGVGSHLVVLFFFKYYNFFAANVALLATFFGKPFTDYSLHILLPIGLSFYSFQLIAYLIDVYKKDILPEKDVIVFFSFVSFFPQIVAGPIERAKHFLVQFHTKRQFEQGQATDGLRQILWGLFKKVVIADGAAAYSDMVFNPAVSYTGSTLLVGALFFSLQIYGDFSGYSDIAIGVAKLFGFRLSQNFAFPYFATNIADFWRRWHISLFTWLRDYVYIPLGGGNGSLFSKIRNIFIVFFISGLWHGANWTFIVWGILNAIFFIAYLWCKKSKFRLFLMAENRIFLSVKPFAEMFITFTLVTFSWIFFRATDLLHAWVFIKKMYLYLFDNQSFQITIAIFNYLYGKTSIAFLLLILFFILVEWRGRTSTHALNRLGCRWRRPLRWIFYEVLLFVILIFAGKNQEFVYFQF
jgi:D-alanyl-lipoteichoic acid acyltransferase DltB (MBOAT superfamily)